MKLQKYVLILGNNRILDPNTSDDTSQFEEVGYEEGGTAEVKGARGSKIQSLVKKLGNGQWQCKDGDTGRLGIVSETDMSPATKLKP